MIICGIYDNKVKSFDVPVMIFRNRAEAIRAWESGVNSQETRMSQHPTDFNLFVIGEFNQDSGVITPFVQHENLGLASDFLKTPDGVKFTSPVPLKK